MVEITYQMVLSTLQTIALIVGITYYLIIMRNSQRNQELARKAQEQAVVTRQAQLFHGVFSTLDDDWWKAYHYWRHVEWTDYSEFAEKALPFSETELGRATSRVGIVFEYLGVLVKEGLVSIRLVALLISNPTLVFWEKFKPIIQDLRSDTVGGRARAMTETEYLYNELIKYLDEHPELKP